MPPPMKTASPPGSSIHSVNSDKVGIENDGASYGFFGRLVEGFMSRLRAGPDDLVETMVTVGPVEVTEGRGNGNGEKGAQFDDGGESGGVHSEGMDLRGERPNGVSSFKAMASLVCVIAGTGTLGMPHAVSETGWLGIILIVLALFMSTTTGIMLIKCLYINSDHRRHSYEDIARESCGLVGYYLAIVTVAINLFGCAVLYVILASSLIQEMAQEYSHTTITLYIYVIICTGFVLLCLVSTKSMKEVAILSIIGASATIGVVIIVIGDSAHMRITHAVETLGVNHKVIHWANIPSSLATIAFAYSGNVVYPHVEHTMRYPKQWPKVVWSALTLCCFLYVSVAVAGYTVFGDTTKSPILGNIPEGAWSIISNTLMVIHVLLAAPIMLTSLSIMVESFITKKWPSFAEGSTLAQFAKRAIDRILIAVLTAFVAAVIPYFGDMMDLLGALTTCLLVFIFPILFYFMLGGMKGNRWWTLLWYLFILIVGIVAMIMGTIDSIKSLIDDFQS
ncbi:hypothetical protein BGZ80_002916 [Entomortierella chlamydospora]|uniref:Amino acid transporter transmembrane domain-containing protein n=1 Tax=Entomortierella chlamydospora TaxID=101097 RepID=A0A9P6SWZ7_9FUNG|nr:hypothetical protein BGZ79_001077 [Entomortierella chlamydospora]KAG0008916.1 hypothetical protein BGZ80_002916 [Entomortierella chlamydospora]